MQKIMFNDRYGQTKAVLEGRKTQKRMIIPVDIINGIDTSCLLDLNNQPLGECEKNYICYETCDGDFIDARCLSRYKIGEEVAIAQSYKDAGIEPDVQVLVKWVRNHAGLYDDAYQKAKYLNGWHNKMFVRADLMPHRIKITYIRIERLQDISDIDCFAEGIEEYITHGGHKVYSYDGGGSFFSPQEAFASLIDKVSGKGTWDSNPYVFVYGFDLIR